MHERVLFDIPRFVDYLDVTQPVDCVVCVQSTLRTNQLLLDVSTLNCERQLSFTHLLPVQVDLQSPERITRFSGCYVHHPADAVLARKKAAGEYGQKKNVNDIGAKSIPDVALAKHRDPPVLLTHRDSAQAVLAPSRLNLLSEGLRGVIYPCFVVEHLGLYEIRRRLSLWLNHVLPGGREAIYGSQYDIQASYRQ